MYVGLPTYHICTGENKQEINQQMR